MGREFWLKESPHCRSSCRGQNAFYDRQSKSCNSTIMNLRVIRSIPVFQLILLIMNLDTRF
jgi:hypothetical protein